MYRFLIRANSSRDAMEKCRARFIPATTIKELWPKRYIMEAPDRALDSILGWYATTGPHDKDACLHFWKPVS